MLSADDIFGQIVFTGNVTGAAYFNVLHDCVIPFLHGTDKISDYWFMKEGIRPHYIQHNFDLLTEHFHDRIMGLDS